MFGPDVPRKKRFIAEALNIRTFVPFAFQVRGVRRMPASQKSFQLELRIDALLIFAHSHNLPKAQGAAGATTTSIGSFVVIDQR